MRERQEMKEWIAQQMIETWEGVIGDRRIKRGRRYGESLRFYMYFKQG